MCKALNIDIRNLVKKINFEHFKHFEQNIKKIFKNIIIKIVESLNIRIQIKSLKKLNEIQTYIFYEKRIKKIYFNNE